MMFLFIYVQWWLITTRKAVVYGVQFTVDRKESGVHIKEFKEVAAFQIISGLKLPEEQENALDDKVFAFLHSSNRKHLMYVM